MVGKAKAAVRQGYGWRGRWCRAGSASVARTGRLWRGGVRDIRYVRIQVGTVQAGHQPPVEWTPIRHTR